MSTPPAGHTTPLEKANMDTKCQIIKDVKLKKMARGFICLMISRLNQISDQQNILT